MEEVSSFNDIKPTMKPREREMQTKRERFRQRERERQTKRERGRQREIERQTKREREG